METNNKLKLIMEILSEKLYRSPVECLDPDAYEELYDASLEVCKIQTSGRIKIQDLVPGMTVYLPKSDQVKHAGEYTCVSCSPIDLGIQEFSDIFGNRFSTKLKWNSTVKLLKYRE